MPRAPVLEYSTQPAPTIPRNRTFILLLLIIDASAIIFLAGQFAILLLDLPLMQNSAIRASTAILLCAAGIAIIAGIARLQLGVLAGNYNRISIATTLVIDELLINIILISFELAYNPLDDTPWNRALPIILAGLIFLNAAVLIILARMLKQKGPLDFGCSLPGMQRYILNAAIASAALWFMWMTLAYLLPLFTDFWSAVKVVHFPFAKSLFAIAHGMRAGLLFCSWPIPCVIALPALFSRRKESNSLANEKRHTKRAVLLAFAVAMVFFVFVAISLIQPLIPYMFN